MATFLNDQAAEREPATVAQAEKTWVYMFNQLDSVEAYLKPKSWDDVKSLLGGKGVLAFQDYFVLRQTRDEVI